MFIEPKANNNFISHILYLCVHKKQRKYGTRAQVHKLRIIQHPLIPHT